MGKRSQTSKNMKVGKYTQQHAKTAANKARRIARHKRKVEARRVKKAAKVRAPIRAQVKQVGTNTHPAKELLS